MKLDYNVAKNLFYWHGELTPDTKKRAEEIGLDYSLPASKPGKAVWFTSSPYAALPLWHDAEPGSPARVALGPLKVELERSRAKEWTGARWSQPDEVELLPYQSAGVDYVLSRTAALLGDQPGLGKTATAIVVANEMKAKRILVVCPAAVRLQWVREIKAWAVGDKRCYVISKAKDGVSPLARWTIVSYDLARSTLLPTLRRGGWDYVIMDEAHYLKSPSAARTQALFGKTEIVDRKQVHVPGIVEGAAMTLALTGTPLPNRPRECYTLARALDHGSIDFASAEAFEARYNPTGSFFGGVREEIGRLPELRSRLRSHFMVRRMKRDVLTQLPQVRYEIDYVEETGAIKRALAAERMLDIDPSDFNSRVTIDGEVSTVRREMGVAKAPHVAERVRTMLDGGLDKLVLFGWHREVLDFWGEKLADFNPERIDGSTSGVGKEKAKRRFIEDPGCRLIFGNLMSMGVGVDGLQKVCDTVLFGENSWVPGDNQQGVDRIDRMGQTSSVTAIFLVARGSIDEKIVSSAARKTRTIHEALDAGL